MGYPKARLPFGQETMLERMVRILGQVVEPIVVVAAEGQDVSNARGAFRLVRDRRPQRGPLEGIAVGLEALAGVVDCAYITACDVPLLVPAFVARMQVLLNDHDVAVPVDGQHHHPLAAVYRTTVVPHIHALLDAEQLRPAYLFDRVDTVRIPVDDLREWDPELRTLANLNEPADYLEALRLANLPVLPAFQQWLKP
jgi:molybdopterin-guanine dinucleotide biosynthesis protein A